MTAAMTFANAEERDTAAGEYVLGTLAAESVPAFESALAGDAALSADVAAWQDRLLGLAARAAPVEPAPALWARIEAGVEALAGASAAAAPRAATPAALPRRASVPQTPWWQRLGLWQGASAFAVAACVVMAALLLLQPPTAEPAQYLALLQSPGSNTTGWIVEARAGGVLKLVPLAGAAPPVPAGRALQFWTKAEGAAGPTSLGLVRAETALSLPVARLPELGERQLFEITLEPEGGSTIGRPTGPILFVGKTVRL